jgi:hypothetical protein
MLTACLLTSCAQVKTLRAVIPGGDTPTTPARDKACRLFGRDEVASALGKGMIGPLTGPPPFGATVDVNTRSTCIYLWSSDGAVLSVEVIPVLTQAEYLGRLFIAKDLRDIDITRTLGAPKASFVWTLQAAAIVATRSGRSAIILAVSVGTMRLSEASVVRLATKLSSQAESKYRADPSLAGDH